MTVVLYLFPQNRRSTPRLLAARKESQTKGTSLAGARRRFSGFLNSQDFLFHLSPLSPGKAFVPQPIFPNRLGHGQFLLVATGGSGVFVLLKGQGRMACAQCGAHGNGSARTDGRIVAQGNVKDEHVQGTKPNRFCCGSSSSRIGLGETHVVQWNLEYASWKAGDRSVVVAGSSGGGRVLAPERESVQTIPRVFEWQRVLVICVFVAKG